MRDYRQDNGDSLHLVTTHNRLPLTPLYSTPTNTIDTHIGSDSGVDDNGQRE